MKYMKYSKIDHSLEEGEDDERLELLEPFEDDEYDFLPFFSSLLLLNLAISLPKVS